MSGPGLDLKTYPDSKVLYRSDTLAPLSVVSNRYQVVQPHTVLEFYRDLVATAGFELETAGVLKGGRKLWALAKTGQETVLKGSDRVESVSAARHQLRRHAGHDRPVHFGTRRMQ